LSSHCIIRFESDGPQLELVAWKAQGATVMLGVPLFVTKNGVDVASGKKVGGSAAAIASSGFRALPGVGSALPKQVTEPEIVPAL
jgi:hypothetical protein